MADHVKVLQRESSRQTTVRTVGRYEITVFLVVLLGVALVAYARATAP